MPGSGDRSFRTWGIQAFPMLDSRSSRVVSPRSHRTVKRRSCSRSPFALLTSTRQSAPRPRSAGCRCDNPRSRWPGSPASRIAAGCLRDTSDARPRRHAGTGPVYRGRSARATPGRLPDRIASSRRSSKRSGTAAPSPGSMAPEEGVGAGGLSVGTPAIVAPRDDRRWSRLFDRAGGGRLRAGRWRRSAACGRRGSAVGAGVDVSRDDHGRLTRNVAVTRTTTTPIAAHASEARARRGAGGSGSEAIGVGWRETATASRTVASSPPG